MDRMVEEMKQIKQSIQAIEKTLTEAHGGWRMLLGIGGGAAILGAIFANLFQGFWTK